MENQEIRAALDRHWAASAAGDIEAEREIYHADVLVEYPQPGERIRSRHNIQALRGHHPAKLGFTVRCILGSGDLWITEYVLSYNEQPTQTVSIMEFRNGKVAHETRTLLIHSSHLLGELSGLSIRRNSSGKNEKLNPTRNG